MEDWLAILTTPTPRGHIGVILIVTQCLMVFCWALRPEVAAARLVAVEGIDAHQFPQFEEVRNAPGPFEGLIKFLVFSGDLHVGPKFRAQIPNQPDCLLQALGVAFHSAVFPQDFAEFSVEGIYCAGAIDR